MHSRLEFYLIVYSNALKNIFSLHNSYFSRCVVAVIFKSRSKALFYRCYLLMVCWYSFLFCFYFMLFGEAKQSTFYFLDNNVFTELKKKKMKQVDFYMLTKKQLFFSKQSHRLYRINPELYPVVWTFVFCVSENKWLSSVLVIFLLLVNNLYCWFYLMGVFFSLRSGLFISCHYWWFKTQLKTRRFYLFLNSITIATVTTIKHRPVIYIYIKQNLYLFWCFFAAAEWCGVCSHSFVFV